MTDPTGRAGRGSSWSAADGARSALKVVVAVLVVAAAARWSFPLPGAAVPQSLQTLAVVLVGAALGPGLGAIAMSCYVLVAALGVPVLADGAAGMEAVMGPSLGYLIGFVIAAFLVGTVARAVADATFRGFVALVLVGVGAHLLILLAGAFRLSFMTDWSSALSGGVSPFLLGGLVKSVAGAVLIRLFFLGVAQGPKSN